MGYKHILFDLDGTLTDSKIGITKSVAYSLNKMQGIDEKLSQLTKFIGPPLKESYMKYYGFNDSEADQAIEYFREYFKEKGIYENELYIGVPELLSKLVSEGKKLYVATSKPIVFAERIIEHFELTKYFTKVMGSNFDGSRSLKAEVIEAVIESIEDIDMSQVIMIGDRKHDIIGAKHFKMASIGVQYGYGELDELEKAGADFVVESVGALDAVLL